LESQWAKIQRFVRAAENVALAANLNKTADSNIQERYAKLVALEHGAFPVPAAQTVAQRIAP